MLGAYARLVEVSQATVRQARQLGEALRRAVNQGSRKLTHTLEELLPRLEQFIEQATRRVFAGEVVPAAEKVVNLFEPHTAIIRKGKPGQAVQFGRVVWLDEVEGGLITR